MKLEVITQRSEQIKLKLKPNKMETHESIIKLICHPILFDEIATHVLLRSWKEGYPGEQTL